MGLNAWITHWREPVFSDMRTFPVIGWEGDPLWRKWLYRVGSALAAAPKQADALVLCGEIPPSWQTPVATLFETMSLPRVTIWLQPDRACPAPDFVPLSLRLEAAALDRMSVAALRRMRLDARQDANRPVLADKASAPWQGVGPYGQGGEGMMGGKPYGRPMARSADDVDQLALDDVETYLGPFFPYWPPGLGLTLRMQGERIRTCLDLRNFFSVRDSPLPSWKQATVAAEERVRLQSHLWWMSNFLALAGMPALGRRALRLGFEPDAEGVRRLVRDAEQGEMLNRLCTGIGVIRSGEAEAHGLRGPLARASGVREDARSAIPAYQQLGFDLLMESAGDVWARWRLRARECLQSLDLMRRGEGLVLAGNGESPPGASRDAASPALLKLVQDKLGGQLWSEAVLFISSLDLDMEKMSP